MKKGSWIIRLLTAGLILAIALPLIGIGLVNVYLSSQAGRDLISTRISRKIGVEAGIEGGSWSPWNGIGIYGLRIEMPGTLREMEPTPLLTVESIRIRLGLLHLIRKRQILIEGLDLKKPMLTLPIELFSQIPVQAVVPEVATNSNPQPPVSAPQTNATSNRTAEPAGQADEAASAVQVPTAPPPVVVEVVEPERPTVWVNVSDAGVQFVSAPKKQPIFEISGVSGGLPVRGRAAKGKISVKHVRCLDHELTEGLNIPVAWRSGILQIGEIKGEAFGLLGKTTARVALSGGMPFQINSMVPEQKGKMVRFADVLEARIGAAAAEGVFQGQLLMPTTWQGQWIARCMEAEIRYEDKIGNFRHGQAVIFYRNGTLGCADARLTGDSLSILGNATALTNGSIAANVRVVAPPEALLEFSKRFATGSGAPFLTALSTPQRSALDFSVFGNLRRLFYKPHPQATPIPIW